MFLGGDVRADRFRLPLHGLRGHLQPGEQRQLFLPLFKRGLAAHHRHHPQHSGRIFRPLHVQFLVAWTLSLVTGRANVVRTLGLDPPQHRHQLLRAPLVVVGRLPAGARNLSGTLALGSQQLLDHRRSRPVHRRAGGHLQGFQVHLSRLAPSGKDHRQQRLYFLRHFPLNGFRRFFSCSGASLSSGRGR